MRHKWLEEIGIDSYPDNHYKIHGIKEFIRHLKYKIQKRKTGVDSRDCWNLDSWYYEWLYEHLMQYKQDAGDIVDLTYYKFTYNNKEYTQLELTNLLCEKLKERILWDEYGLDNEDKKIEVWEQNVKKERELESEIFDIWKLIINATWW